MTDPIKPNALASYCTENEGTPFTIPAVGDELIRLYTFNEADLALIRQHRGAQNRLGFAVLLCYMRYPGILLGVDAEPSPHLLTMVAVGCVLAACLLLLGRDPVFVLSGPYYLASLGIYLGVALWYAWRLPRVGVWILAGIVVLLVGSIYPILRTMQLVPQSFLTQYGAQIGAAIEIPLLLIALYLRNRERRDNQARVGALSRVDPLTGTANHRVMLARLEQLLRHQQRDPDAGVVIRVRIGNIQEIRADHGLQVAQMALVHAGACITHVVREGDTVARHRDGDFVVILEGRVAHDQVADLGQRLIARGLAPSELLPPGTVLQLKVAVAATPFQASGVALLLQVLETAVSELAAKRGKALRFVA